MKAAVLTAFGPPEVLQVRDVPAPAAPRDGELLVRVHASTVNYGDRLARNAAAVTPRAFHMPWLFWALTRLTFGLRRPRVPVLGNEFAGTVQAVGPGVTRFRVGDAVFGYRGTAMGAYAEHLVVRESGLVAPKPSTLSFVEAASCPYGALVALGILRQLAIRPRQRLLVIGASGRVGQALVQLAAAHLGAAVTGVCSTPRLGLVTALGAEAVVDHTRADVTAGPGVYDVVIDVLGTTRLAQCRRILAPDGQLVYVSFKLPQLLQMLRTSAGRGPRVRCLLANEQPADLERIRGLIEAGIFRPVVDRVFPLDEVAAAHRYAESGAAAGAVVVVVTPAADA